MPSVAIARIPGPHASGRKHDVTQPDRPKRRDPLPSRAAPLLPVPAPRGRHGESSRPSGRAAPHFLLCALGLFALAAAAGCASSDSARYVQFREIQANLDDRAAEALDAGLIDIAMAKRILAISEAVTEQAWKYRAALAAGSPPGVTRAILDVIQRLLDKAEIFLPDKEIVR